MLNSQLVYRFTGFGRNKWEQQSQCITITCLGVAREISLANQVFQQKTADPGTDEIFFRHGSPPIGHNVESAGWLHAEAPASYSDNAGYLQCLCAPNM